jgi:hypothetical protein
MGISALPRERKLPVFGAHALLECSAAAARTCSGDDGAYGEDNGDP